jgi:hypothetical protein
VPDDAIAASDEASNASEPAARAQPPERSLTPDRAGDVGEHPETGPLRRVVVLFDRV